MIAPEAFWNHKILRWESFRYSPWSRLHPFAWPVRARLTLAAQTILECGSRDWKILELGCGSGVLAEQLIGECRSYVGIDFAENAISKARERLRYSNHFTFGHRDILEEEFADADLTVFLGVTDWLDPRQMVTLFKKLRSPRILFSFTDQKVVSGFNPYRLYRRRVDVSHYAARSYSLEEIDRLLAEKGYSCDILKAASAHNPGVLVWAQRP